MLTPNDYGVIVRSAYLAARLAGRYRGQTWVALDEDDRAVARAIGEAVYDATINDHFLSASDRERGMVKVDGAYLATLEAFRARVLAVAREIRTSKAARDRDAELGIRFTAATDRHWAAVKSAYDILLALAEEVDATVAPPPRDTSDADPSGEKP